MEQFECKFKAPLALFTIPATKCLGEKRTYPVPTYEAIRGMLESVYWKPTINYIVDEIRVMKPIKYMSMSTTFKNLLYSEDRSMGTYVCLKDVEYNVKFHYEFTKDERYIADRIWEKHNSIIRRSIESGGRRDIYFGDRSFQGYVEPCSFYEGDGHYDLEDYIPFNMMYHSTNYYDDLQEKHPITVNYDNIEMRNGVIKFNRPMNCAINELGKDLYDLKGYN